VAGHSRIAPLVGPAGRIAGSFPAGFDGRPGPEHAGVVYSGQSGWRVRTGVGAGVLSQCRAAGGTGPVQAPAPLLFSLAESWPGPVVMEVGFGGRRCVLGGCRCLGAHDDFACMAGFMVVGAGGAPSKPAAPTRRSRPHGGVDLCEIGGSRAANLRACRFNLQQAPARTCPGLGPENPCGGATAGVPCSAGRGPGPGVGSKRKLSSGRIRSEVSETELHRESSSIVDDMWGKRAFGRKKPEDAHGFHAMRGKRPRKLGQ